MTLEELSRETLGPSTPTASSSASPPEAQRIRNAHLFDPYLAVATSLVKPLPHQITAVYGELLPRHHPALPLVDDPGAARP
jgi:hypothetical protein